MLIEFHSLLAGLSASVCVWRATSAKRKLASLAAPTRGTLLGALLVEIDATDFTAPRARQTALAALNQRLSDVKFELDLLPTRLTALTRISLASGMVLALLGYIDSTHTRSSLERSLVFLVCAAIGLIGAACVAAIGRTAKLRSRQIRADWDQRSREAGSVLGTTLEAARSSAHS